MIETYAERLEREEKEKMTNYNFDEMKRQEKAKVERNLGSADYDGCLGQTDIPSVNPKWNERRSDEDMTEKMKEFAQDILDHESTIEIKLDDGDLLHLAKAAHERNITLNQLCNNIIKGSFDDLDYRFEHSSKPVVLSEY
tara:strand:+ start:52 stop:471 length:420 start_codon:yes stop_codon:yes gene_type:complete